MSFGQRLRIARKNAKMTQDQLGEVCGVTKATVSGWEADRYTPAFAQLPLMANALSVSLDSLILEKCSMSKDAISMAQAYDRMSESKKRRFAAALMLFADPADEDKVASTLPPLQKLRL